MKFFVDTADIDEIKEAFDLGIISGVTTNPVLMERAGTMEMEKRVKKIRSICDCELFAQVLGKTKEEILPQARIISSWCDNITVKIPLNIGGIQAISQLNRENIRTLTSIVYDVGQALAAAVAGATYIAPFVHRSKEVGWDGKRLVQNISEIYQIQNVKTQIVAASIATPLDVIEMAECGAQIVTASLSVWKALIKNKMTDETLDSFLVNWKNETL